MDPHPSPVPPTPVTGKLTIASVHPPTSDEPILIGSHHPYRPSKASSSQPTLTDYQRFQKFLQSRRTLIDAPPNSDQDPDLASDEYRIFLEFQQFRALRAYEHEKEARAPVVSGKQLIFYYLEPSPPRSASNEPPPLALANGRSAHDPIVLGTPFQPRPYFPPPSPHPLALHSGAPSDQGPLHSDLPTSRGTWQSPFTPAIENFPNLDKFKLSSNIGIYQGDSDSEDHLSNFCTFMEFYRVPGPTWCRAFPMTLQGKARLWFHTLKPGSISSFIAFEDNFVSHFLQCKHFDSTVIDLMGARQEPSESIQQYLDRFNQLSL